MNQAVCVNHSQSDPSLVTCGISQGSILGPRLFLCYANGIEISISSESKLLLCADVCAILFSHQDPETISRNLRPEVIKLFSCSTQLSMKFFVLVNVKMPTVVGILTFMSGKNCILGLSGPKKAQFPDSFYPYEHLKFHAHDKSFITSGPGSELESCSRWLVDNKLPLHMGKMNV